MQISGRLIEVFLDNVGTSLQGEHASGATVLQVASAYDFIEDEPLLLGGVEYMVTDIDDESEEYGLITISPGLVELAEDGVEVLALPLVEQKFAMVREGDLEIADETDEFEDEQEDEDIIASVSPLVADTLEVGERGDEGEYVLLDDESGEWELVKVYGVSGEVDASYLFGTIPDAVLAETQMKTDLDLALGRIQDIDAELATGLGIQVYRQDDPPTGDIRPNSIWIDTNDGNKMHTWNAGTSMWVSAQDQVAIDAMQLAQEANANLLLLPDVYRQSTEPADKTAGSIWFNTANGNRIYTADGTTYTLAQQTAIIGSQLVGTAIDGFTITGSIFQTSAAAGNGTTAGVRFGSTGIYAYNNASDTPTVSITASTGILQAVGAIITGQLNATSGSITGVLDMSGSGVIRTAASGQRVQMSTSGLIAYNSGGTAVTTISSSTGAITATAVTLTGTINATAGTFSGNLTLGGNLTLNGSGFIRTAASGQRVQLSTVGLETYNASNAVTGALSAASGGLFLTGELLVAGNITLDGGMFRTATSGQRIEITSTGVTSHPTPDPSPSVPNYRAELQAGFLRWRNSIDGTVNGFLRVLTDGIQLSGYEELKIISSNGGSYGDLHLLTNGGYAAGKIKTNNVYSFQAAVTNSRQVYVNANTGYLHTPTSNPDLKTDVKEYQADREAFYQLRTVRYRDKAEYEAWEAGETYVNQHTGRERKVPKPMFELGLMAPEVAALGFGDLTGKDEHGNHAYIDYSRFVVPMIDVMVQDHEDDLKRDRLIEEQGRQLADQERRLQLLEAA